MKTRLLNLGIALACAGIAPSCSNIHEADRNRELARTTGKYYVELTEDAERVQGTCQFLRALNAIEDPVKIPSQAELPDYFRERGAYYGADTVLLQGMVGELYICGSGPLNPDGTRKAPYAPPHPTPPS